MSDKAELQREIEFVRQEIVVLERQMKEWQLQIARMDLREAADEWEDKIRAARGRGELVGPVNELWTQYLAEIAPYEQRVEELEKNYDY